MYTYVYIYYFFILGIPLSFRTDDQKSLKAYQHLLSYIQRSIIDLSQATFITDYETGLRSAIEKVSLIQNVWLRFITMKDKRLAQYIR